MLLKFQGASLWQPFLRSDRLKSQFSFARRQVKDFCTATCSEHFLNGAHVIYRNWWGWLSHRGKSCLYNKYLITLLDDGSFYIFTSGFYINISLDTFLSLALLFHLSFTFYLFPIYLFISALWGKNNPCRGVGEIVEIIHLKPFRFFW